jgi:hypothetical protein
MRQILAAGLTAGTCEGCDEAGKTISKSAVCLPGSYSNFPFSATLFSCLRIELDGGNAQYTF